MRVQSFAIFVLALASETGCLPRSEGTPTAPEGSSGAGGTSADAGDASKGGTCTEFVLGGQNEEGIGGSAKSRVTAQSIADFGGASARQISQLTAACKAMAVALGSTSADQTAAEALAEPRKKARAWCLLATRAFSLTKAMANGTTKTSVGPASCRLSAAIKAACQARCSGASSCDLKATPFVCTGGQFDGDFCIGGKLEGGCNADAKCDSDCDVSVAAFAQCVSLPVSVTTTFAADPAAAANLKTTVEANLPMLLGVKAHFELEGKQVAVASAVAERISDLKPACIPVVVSAGADALEDVTTGAGASNDFLGAVF